MKVRPIRRWSRLTIVFLLTFAVLLTVGLGTGVLAIGDVASSDTETDFDAQNGSNGTVTGSIDDDLFEAAETNDETLSVLVHFEEVDVSAQTPEEATTTLKQQSETAQAPLVEFADSSSTVTVERQFWITNAALVTVDGGEMALESLGAVEGVEAIEPNAEVSVIEPAAIDNVSGPYANGSTTSTQTGSTYGLDQINAPDVWEQYGTRGEGVRVAVLDTGIDPDHPDLELYTDDSSDPTYPGGWAEFDRYGNEEKGSQPYDSGDNGHGTHVSGTVAGGNESGEHIGVAPEAKLMHGMVLDGDQGTLSQILAGMEWAVEEDADVISMSLGGPCGEYMDGYVDPIRNAEQSGTMVISAIGNEGEGCTGSPANAYDGLSIGASDENEQITSFSGGEIVQTSDWVNPPADWPNEYVTPDVSAPGNVVISTLPANDYGFYSGTSMATPHVSGVAALMQSATEDELSPAEIEAGLTDSAWKPDGETDDQDVRYGHGIIDAQTAVADVRNDIVVEGSLENHHGKTVTKGVIGILDADTGEVVDAKIVDSAGDFEIMITDDSVETVDVLYYRTNHEMEPISGDYIPAVYAIDRIDTNDSGALGTVQFPEPHLVTTTVQVDNDSPAPDASAILSHVDGSDASIGWVFETDEDGQITFHEDEDGVHLTGDIFLEVTPPQSDQFVNTTYSDSATVTEPTDFTVDLEQTPVVESATRSVTNDSIAPGENTTVTVDVDVVRNGTFELTEAIDPELVENGTVTINDAELSHENKSVNPYNSSSLGYGFVENVTVDDVQDDPVTLEYTIAVDENATVNQTLGFNGATTDLSGPITTDGHSSVWVGEQSFEEAYLRSVSDDDGVVQAAGLSKGISDWREGTINAGLLQPIIDSWRSGKSVLS